MPRPRPEWYAEAVALREKGHSPREIAAALNVPIRRVYYAIKPELIEKRTTRAAKIKRPIIQHPRIECDPTTYLSLKPHHWLSIYMNHKAAGREDAAALADAEVKAQRGRT
jgi:transglutaminase-like putative cysteine protease